MAWKHPAAGARASANRGGEHGAYALVIASAGDRAETRGDEQGQRSRAEPTVSIAEARECGKAGYPAGAIGVQQQPNRSRQVAWDQPSHPLQKDEEIRFDG